MVREIQLRMLDDYTGDRGKDIIRLDYDSMNLLGVDTGEIIEIKGERIGIAKCMPLFPSDQGKGIARLDLIEMMLYGISLGSSVSLINRVTKIHHPEIWDRLASYVTEYPDRIEKLKKLGLSGDQTQIFSFLAIYGPKTSLDVCELLDLEKTDGYAAISELKHMGLVSTTSDLPPKIQLDWREYYIHYIRISQT